MKDFKGRSIPHNLRISVRRDVMAEVLWEYGEEALAERVLALSDEELHQVHRLAVWHRVNDPESDEGPKLTNGRLLSRAAIDFFEAEGRDMHRRRRRTRPQAERYDWTYLQSLQAGDPLPDSPAERAHYPGWDS